MQRDTFLAFGVLLLILAALAAKSLLLSLPPVRHAPGEFDAGRAKARLASVLGDQRPHPADSGADDAVRARLVATLQQMGLHPAVHDQMACNDFQKARLVACARVRNVIAALGPSNGKALLLSAHYDSVPVGPGASDDGIGVATLLEVGSLLKDRPLSRPVILLFNEGEELGLVGARAFLADPLSKNVDSLLNFEARGVNGPVTMFETNQPNGAAIAAYASAVRRPYASSLSTDVARLIPNDTDVTTFKQRGWVTLNSAIVGNETRYHSPGDNLSGLDARSLQDMGDEALALATTLSAGVPKTNGTRIFFDLAQHVFIDLRLVVGAVWLLFLLALFAFLAARRGALVRGTGSILAAFVAAGVLAWLSVTLMGMLRAGTYWRAHPEVTFVAIYATALLGEIAVFRTLGRKLETREARPAYWFVFLLLGVLLALAAPGGIIYFLLPPSLVLIGILLARWYEPAEAIGAFAGGLLLYASWGELLSALEELFSPGPLWVVAPAAAIIIAPLLIEATGLFRRSDRRILVTGSAVIAAVAWIVAATTPAYSQDHQQRFTIEHLTEFPSGHSSWSVLNDGAVLPAAYSSAGAWRRGKLDFSQRERWLASAPPAPQLRPASLRLVGAVNNGPERTVRIRLEANGAERIVLVAPATAQIRAAGVPSFIRPAGDRKSTGKFTISCTGRSCDGAELTIIFRHASNVTFTVVGSRNGLPVSAAQLVRARPRFARPQYTPDETVTITQVRI
jgi:Peptidase family M28